MESNTILPFSLHILNVRKVEIMSTTELLFMCFTVLVHDLLTRDNVHRLSSKYQTPTYLNEILSLHVCLFC